MHIQIITDKGLPERMARINLRTWQAVKAKKHGTFFPEGDVILVGNNPFDPSYILFAVDNGMPENQFMVSEDVKKLVYPNTDYLEF